MPRRCTVKAPSPGDRFQPHQAGAGTLTLDGANTYTGGTVVSNGLLFLGQAAAFPSGTAAAESLTVAGGTLDLNGNSITVSSLNGPGAAGAVDTISGGTPTLTVGDFNANGVFSGAIQNTAGSLTLSKTGAGSLTLGGASTYSGGTTVGSGTLLVTNTTGSGTGSGSVTVNSGATFGGSGIVDGSVGWQAGSSAAFVQGSPLTVNSSVALNNNAVTIDIPGETPLGVGTYTLMTYNNSGSSGSFSSVGIQFAGAGLEAGKIVAITNGNGLAALVVTVSPNLSGTWTNNGNGNWSAATNWDSNPSFPLRKRPKPPS